MIHYFLHDGNQELGPFDIDQLKAQKLKKNTKIWREGLEAWTTAGELEEIKHLVISTPPPLAESVSAIISGPPKIEQLQESSSNHNTNLSVEPARWKNKLIKFLLILAGALVISGIGGWLIYQNLQNREILNAVNEEVNAQKNTQDEKEEQRRRTNQAITEKNMNYRNNWPNYIKVDHNEPRVDYTLGGISSFDVYISNETTYMLDQVDVYVEYIRKNGDVYQTRTVSIFNIPAGATEAGVAPSSVNGVKVRCEISKIVSKKMHFCYPADNGNPEDPYFCK